MTAPRFCVVTAGHLATTPRMLKAADALHAAGYAVRVVSANHTPWATAVDRDLIARRGWRWTPVDYDHTTARTTQVATGARFRAAQAVAAMAGAERVPEAIAIRAYSRAHDELVRAIAMEPADFVYGGTTGALAALADGARRLGVPYGIDLEDFHSGEREDEQGRLVHALAERVERAVLGAASILTAASPMIADAYRRKYRVRPLAIHNTFSIAFGSDGAPPSPAAPLRLYWFSQTLGPGRGLDDVVRALGRTNRAAELHLRARPIATYVEALTGIQRAEAPLVRLVIQQPADSDSMVRLAQNYDAGLSCEEPTVLNHRLCLGNKIFTYLAAGVPVVLSRTPAQAELARVLGSAAIAYDCGDVDGLAAQFQRLADDGEARREAKSAARGVAQRRWHWEHPADQGALLDALTAAVSVRS